MATDPKTPAVKPKSLGATLVWDEPTPAATTVTAGAGHTVRFHSTDNADKRAFSLSVLTFDDDNDKVVSVAHYDTPREAMPTAPTFSNANVTYPPVSTTNVPQMCCLVVTEVLIDWENEDHTRPDLNNPAGVEIVLQKILTVV